jgi:hypothetical protein
MLKTLALAGLLATVTTSLAIAQTIAVPVSPDTFVHAETDVTMAAYAKEGALGKFMHGRTPASIEDQKIVRMNRDTLYSFGIFDLDAGPVTLTLPETGKRYMMAQVIDQDHYTHDINYTPGPKTYVRGGIGTRYMIVIIRTLANPGDGADLKQVHALQDAIKVGQASPGELKIPNWDAASQEKVRGALKVLGTTLPDSDRMFGSKQEVDPVRHLIGAAVGWGGNPNSAAMYLSGQPKNDDGTHIEKLTVKDVPVDGFWSISVYNAAGFFEKNALNAYSLNNLTAKPGADGSVTVQFGGCEGTTPNCLPITKGWNYTVRFYRPRKELMHGTWKFPETQAVN